MEKIKCSKCGFENEKDNNYCIECGKKLNSGFFSRLRSFFSSENDKKLFKEFKKKRLRIKHFNEKYSFSSNPNNYISSPTEDILRKNKDIYEKLDDFKKLKLNSKDYESLDDFYYNYNNLKDIVENLNKKFLKSYYLNNKEIINDFLNLNGYIDNYKNILNENKIIYKNLSYCNNSPDDVKKFIERYENFEEISKEINERYIEYNLDLNKINKFIDNYIIEIDYENKIDEDRVLSDYSKEYNLAKKIENPNDKIKEFISCYEDFNNISNIINNEIDRRNKLQKNFSNNLIKINEFIDSYDNPSEDEYIKDYSDILNQYKTQYDVSVQLIEFKKDETAKKFINLFDNFPNIVKNINKKYVEKLNNKFNQIKPEINDFNNEYKDNISYNHFIDENEEKQILNKYKFHYEISSELIDIDSSNTDKSIINQFIQLYDNFNNVILQINDEYNQRHEIYENFNQQKTEIIDFINTYEKEISQDLYITNSEYILNHQKSNYDILLNYKNYFSDNSEIISSFIQIYENFEEISNKINKEFTDNKYNQYLKSESNIKEFIQEYDLNIYYNQEIDDTKKQEVLNQLKSQFDLCVTLKKINKSNSIIDSFVELYSNFDKVVLKINNEIKRRNKIINEFESKKSNINQILDKYQNNVSEKLFILDYKLVLKDNKKLYDLSKMFLEFSNDSLAEEFVLFYDNFKDISFNINQKYCKNKYGVFTKNFPIIKNQLDKFSNLTINEYIKNKKPFINEYFDIYSQSKEILEFDMYLNLPNDELNIINQFVELYDCFDVNFIEEYKNRYYKIELESLDFVESYRFNIISVYYIKNYNQILKDFKSNYDLLKDIKMLEEIDFDVDDFIQVYENLDLIVEKTNRCYIKRILHEFNLIKKDIISFIRYFNNLQGYIRGDKIIQVNKNKYDKLKEIQEIPVFKTYLQNDYCIILDFINFYENYNEIILKHNIEYVNEYYNENRIQIKEYIDVLEKNQSFYLSDSKLNQLSNNFKSTQNIVKNLCNYQKDYKYLKNTQLIDNFPNKFNLSENEVKNINECYINRELDENKEFFDTILKHPLDDNQRRAVVIDEDNTQIIAGAGTGKTYTLQAKIKYLVEKKGVSPDSILALSFSNLSVNDLKEQIDKMDVDIDISTFHSLGLSILKDNGVKAKVLDYGLKTAIKKYFTEYLLDNPDKIENILKYFAYYIYTPLDMEKIGNIGELYEYENGYNLETLYSKFKKLKDPSLEKRTLQGEYVKSLEERIIANFLFLNGIKYTYEKGYTPLLDYEDTKYYLFDFLDNVEIPNDITLDLVHKLLNELEIDDKIYWSDGEELSNYNPDFYLDDYGIYYEHFGVNRNCEAPWLPHIKEISYFKMMQDKRALHKKYGTELIETYSYYHSENRLLQRLKEKLLKNNVEFKPFDSKELIIRILASETKINEYYEFVRLIETFINLFKGNGYKKDKFEEFRKINKKLYNGFIHDKHELFLTIAEEIYDYYYIFLKDNSAIDFNDMINNACDFIQEKGYSKNYSYIIVDEYQDTSHTRYNLLKSIKDYYNAKLIIVGDDWQSIYRFTGCDVDLFTNFDEYFDTKTEICEITNTYRNSKSLIDISGNFIMKNDHQYKKQLISKAPNQIDGSVVSCQYLNKNDQPFLFEHIINEIYKNSEKKDNVKILVLGRNNADYKSILHENLFTTSGSTDNNNLRIIYNKNPKIKIKFLTVHGSKGLEENNVIVLNLEDKKAGFPNKMEDDSVLFFVKNQKDEGISFAEERRLFYVALTRTRNYTFLFSPKINPSIFVEELNEDNELVEFKFERMYEEDDEDDRIRIISATNGTCPDCGTGKMVLKFNPKSGKSFFNCSNWPRCGWFGGRYYGDINEVEKFINCPKCNGIMVKRQNRSTGEHFYGCTNYFSFIDCRFSYKDEEVNNPHYCPDCGNLLKINFLNEYYCPSIDCNFSCDKNEYEKFVQEKKEIEEKEIDAMIEEAKKLEKRKNYEEAIEIYSSVENNFEAYKRLCICYRREKSYDNELNIIFKSIHNKSISDKEKKFFKKRIKEFNFENSSKNKIKKIKSHIKCPNCGKPIELKIVEKRDIMYITCSDDECYWFGGVYEGEIEDFESYML